MNSFWPIRGENWKAPWYYWAEREINIISQILRCGNQTEYIWSTFRNDFMGEWRRLIHRFNANENDTSQSWALFSDFPEFLAVVNLIQASWLPWNQHTVSGQKRYCLFLFSLIIFSTFHVTFLGCYLFLSDSLSSFSCLCLTPALAGCLMSVQVKCSGEHVENGLSAAGTARPDVHVAYLSLLWRRDETGCSRGHSGKNELFIAHLHRPLLQGSL